MFSYFEQVIEFLSQIVYWLNWGINTCQGILSTGTQSLTQWTDFFSALPAPVSWLCISTLTVSVFKFIRGR